MKTVLIVAVLLLALIGGGVVMLGGAGYFVHSKIESRAAEIEEAMMAEMTRCAPEGWPKEMLDAQRVMVKKLAQTAAQIEVAEALKEKNQRVFKEDAPVEKSKIDCPKVERVSAPSSLKRYEIDYKNQQVVGTSMDRAGWKFGDPVVDVAGTRP